ncbi:MAG TPA: hypothetical protein VGN18_05040 [Jatrophihabitans sp.]|jgi:hypothetical protein|uniref:hypothetical protein n=1 Tax=Jatrophihabitans sp. TaxID=1932789 RepID=UPI002DFFF105|nr:hypothetical protein [Jatrophihabitans sp.]
MRLDPFPDPDALPRVIGRADALRRGFSRHAIDHRLSTGQWDRVLPRTYFTGETMSDLDRCRAALAFAGSGAALSGTAALWAAQVRRVPCPQRVLILVPPSNRTRSRDWVQVRCTFRPITVARWSGPRRVEPARATADACLALRRLDDVRTLVARVVQDGGCRLDELAGELEAGPRRGSAFLRQALAEVGWGAASAPEAEAATILRRAGLTGFEQNATLVLPDGSTRVVDFYWPGLRACLEIDSVEWHFDQRDWAGTWDRHLDLTTFGYSVIHRPPSALRDRARFVSDVRAWLGGRERDLRRGLA